ncbi:MAG: hypothetical protein JNL58_15735 [Planctomyces sp.]|nr:hypothetical protein [Planctomyces sp.]
MSWQQSVESNGALLIFSDDWGRHPSSCQHLTRHLLQRYPVTWVNTIGTRAPRLNLATAQRALEKLRDWTRRNDVKTGGDEQSGQSSRDGVPDARPEVVSPRMWPWFSQKSDRKLNRWLLRRQLQPLIERMPRPVTALTTLPITADLAGVLPVDRWVYYCVDDFSQWPGLDGDTLRRMDREMIRKADSIVAVSETLQSMIATEGRVSTLLTHGVDVDFWKRPQTDTRITCRVDELLPKDVPLIVFWGVADRRMNTASLRALSKALRTEKIVIVGPTQDPDPAICSLPNVVMLPALPIETLPYVAAKAAVLIMPYSDLPVTRAMQPLKLKEYLATGRPVVANHLPSVEPWVDCLDSACNPEQFASLVLLRLRTGTPISQRLGRKRLEDESWSVKAMLLEEHFCSRIVSARSAADQVGFIPEIITG